MDVDLQDPPELIVDFLDKWREGYDIVYGIRQERRADDLGKRLTARWFYALFNKFSETQIPNNVGDYRLLDRRVVEIIKLLPERNRFSKGLFAWVGFKSVGVPYVRHGRSAGTSKWCYWKLWNYALDGLVSFSTLPLRVWTYFGGLVALAAFLYGLFIVVWIMVFGRDVPGYASLLTTMLFLGGVQLLSLGIIGEYIGRLFLEVKARPLYVVDQIVENTPTDRNERSAAQGQS
jgi:glycosyltransferase involved in cell wall biosynthesis